jgi:hypothetical protein
MVGSCGRRGVVDAEDDVDGVGAEEEAEVSLNSGGAIFPSALSHS